MPTKNSVANTTFSDRVREIVARIPRGQVKTYKEVARLAGNEKASRAVATTMKKNYLAAIPCHRVILSSGKPGGYNRGGQKAKLALLLAEGWNQHIQI